MMPNDSTKGESRSLDETKQRVRAQFLGKYGIHGIGEKKTKNAVRIYVSDSSGSLEEVLDEIQALCLPYSIDVVREEAPQKLTSPSEAADQEKPSDPGSEETRDV